MYHQHDCDKCVYLGSSRIGLTDYDYYICKSKNPHSDSIICRFGSEGYQYASYHPPEAFAGETILSHVPHYMECMKRVTLKGLYVGKHKQVFIDYVRKGNEDE